MNVGHIALNCDEFAVVSSVECLLYASATKVKIVKLKTTAVVISYGWWDRLFELK